MDTQDKKAVGAYLDEKIKKASATWKGVDVDKYMNEVRGRELNEDTTMTAQEIIEKIRAEVERRIKKREESYVDNNTLELKNQEDRDIIEILDTLQEQPVKTDIVEDLKHYLATTPKEQIEKDWESLKEWGKVGPSVSEFLGWEQPVCEGLEEEIDRLWNSFADEMEGPHNIFDVYARLARHFAQWGAEHRGSSEIPNDLEEAAGEYEKKHTYKRYDGGGFTPEYDATLAEAVIFGAKWQKAQSDKELSEKIASAYQLGLADKEKQMMKELRSYCLDEMERFQGADAGSRAAREVYYDIIGYLDNHGCR